MPPGFISGSRIGRAALAAWPVIGLEGVVRSPVGPVAGVAPVIMRLRQPVDAAWLDITPIDRRPAKMEVDARICAIVAAVMPMLPATVGPVGAVTTPAIATMISALVAFAPAMLNLLDRAGRCGRLCKVASHGRRRGCHRGG